MTGLVLHVSSNITVILSSDNNILFLVRSQVPLSDLLQQRIQLHCQQYGHQCLRL